MEIYKLANGDVPDNCENKVLVVLIVAKIYTLHTYIHIFLLLLELYRAV